MHQTIVWEMPIGAYVYTDWCTLVFFSVSGAPLGGKQVATRDDLKEAPEAKVRPLDTDLVFIVLRLRNLGNFAFLWTATAIMLYCLLYHFISPA